MPQSRREDALILLPLLLACQSPVVDTSTLTVDSSVPEPFDPYAAGLVGDPRAGQARFGPRCSSCHGANGGGALGPPLGVVVPGRTDLDLYRVITEGQDGMPAIDVTPQEGVHLVAWLQESFGS